MAAAKHMSGSERKGKEIVRLRPLPYSTEHMAGLGLCGFVIDVSANRIVDWRVSSSRVSSSMETTFTPGALEQTLWADTPMSQSSIASKGSQYSSSLSPQT